MLMFLIAFILAGLYSVELDRSKNRPFSAMERFATGCSCAYCASRRSKR
jgi:hypothetical protein